MTANATLAAVFSWFQNITSSCTLLNWSIISINHISMSRALRAQGYTRDDLPYKFAGGEFAAYYSLFFAIIFLLTGGFPCLSKGTGNFLHFSVLISSSPCVDLLYFW